MLESTFSDQPADVGLLKKGKKALLLIFGGEPETQPEKVKLKLDFEFGKDKTIELEPMGMVGLEIGLE